MFRDIHPTHKFYEQHGLAGPRMCAGSRPGGRVPAQVMRGFEDLDGGTDVGERMGAERVLRCEQRGTLQAAAYDDRASAAREATRWAGSDRVVRAGGARPAEVTFSAECEGTPSERFEGLNLAHLEERWPYARRVANRFHAMVGSADGRRQVDQALGAPAGGGR